MVLGKLLGGGTVKAVANVIDELHTSEEEKQQLKNRFEEIQAKLKSKQMDINLADAKSTAGGLSGFMQRSWRPLIGMSCAIAIFWEFVLSKLILEFVFANAANEATFATSALFAIALFVFASAASVTTFAT